MAYDPATGDMVLFGGYGNSGYLSDTWTFAQMIEVPGAPTKVKGTPGNAEVTVGWTPPSDNGSPIDTYTASVVGDSSEFCTYTVATDSGDDCVITGLTNGDSYQFQVTAHNAAGDGPASTASSSVTPAPVPGAPTIGTAKAGNASATLTWTAPSSNRGSAIIGYVVTPYIGITAQTTQTFTSTATTETATGLTNRTAYTFRVAAFNTVGTGTNSAASNSVTPTKATSKIVLRLSTTKVTYGHEQVLHLSVTVSPEFAGSTPTGTVPVKDSTTTLCVIKLSSGKGSCRLSLKVGTYRLVATYGGSTNFKSSTSAKETLTVTKTAARTTQSPSGPSGPTSCIGETSKCAVAFPAVDDFGLSVLLVGKVIENTPCPDRGVCDQPAGDQLDTVLVGMGTRPGMTDPGIEMPNFSLILAGGGKGRIDSITCDKSVEYALCGLGAEAPNTSFVGVIVFDVPIGSTWQSVDFAYHSGSTSKVYVFTK
jgi:titin